MRVYAIADPHLSRVHPKPMTVFGAGWEGHPEAFFRGWREVVGEEDLVVVPGDISWAMRLSEDVIRYLTIKQDGPMPAPRAIPGTPSEAAPMAPAASTEDITAAV